MVKIIKNHKFENQNRKTIIIVPETISHEYERMLCEKFGNQISKDVEVLTFNRISRRVFEEIGGFANTYMNEAGRILSVYKAINMNLPSLKIFNKKKPDIAKHILEIIDKFKIQSISEEDLLIGIEKTTGKLHDKLYDLYLIYASYNKIAKEDLLDPRDEFQFLIDNFYKTEKFDEYLFYFDHFTHFTPKQIEFLEEIFAKEIDVCINFEIFNNYKNTSVEQTLLKLERVCKDKKFEYETTENRSEQFKFLEFANKLFEIDEEILEINDIFLHKSENMQNECLYVGSKIIEILNENSDINYNDFVISAPNFQTYKNTLEIAFSRLNLPIYISNTEKVATKSPIKLIFSAFDAIMSGFSTQSVIKYLKNPMTFEDAKINELIEYITCWNIKYLPKKTNFSSHPKHKMRKLDDDDLQLLNELNDYKNEVLEPLYNLEASLKKSKTGLEFTLSIFNFCEEINLPLKILNLKIDDLKIKQQFNQIWDTIVDALEQFNNIYRHEKLEKDEFIALFKNILSSYDLATIPSNATSIYAGDLKSLKKCKYLFILGLNSDDFPQKYTENTILSDFDKQTLSDIDIKIDDFGIDVLNQNDEIMHRALTMPSEKLFFSYSEVTTDKKIPADLFEKSRKILLNTLVTSDKSCNYEFFYKSKSLALEHLALNGDESTVSEIENSYFSVLNKRINDEILLEMTKNIYYNEISPTQINLYNSCPFAYFLKFGLKLNTKEKMTFNNLLNGNFLHFILEKYIKNIIKTGDFWIKNHNNEIIDISEIKLEIDENVTLLKKQQQSMSKLKKQSSIDDASKNISEISNKLEVLLEKNSYFEEKLNENLSKTELNLHEIIMTYFNEFFASNLSHDIKSVFDMEKVKKNAHILVNNTLKEIYLSNFKPKYCEFLISKERNITYNVRVNEIDFSIKGVVDRIDFCEKNNLLKIIDYKSGKTEYNPTKIANGIDMQMFLYALALENSDFGDSASVSYTHSVMPTLSEKPENFEDSVDKNIKRSGISLKSLNNDDKIDNFLQYDFSSEKIYRNSDLLSKEGFENLKNIVNENATKTVHNISNGCINISPYSYKNRTSCDICEHNSICGFCPDYDKFREFLEVKTSDFERKEDE